MVLVSLFTIIVGIIGENGHRFLTNGSLHWDLYISVASTTYTFPIYCLICTLDKTLMSSSYLVPYYIESILHVSQIFSAQVCFFFKNLKNSFEIK